MASYPAISEPTPDPKSLQNTTLEIKQTVEILTGQRKPVLASAVTWQDLLDLGLIKLNQVPK